MKVVINVCFGGFGLSRRGLQRWAELKGRECYFYQQTAYRFREGVEKWARVAVDAEGGSLFVHAFDVPDAIERGLVGHFDWSAATDAERQAHNEAYKKHSLYHGDIERTDPDLVRVVEELGEAADGDCAKLHVVEIPDGTAYEIDEYDGNEHIAETHRTWR